MSQVETVLTNALSLVELGWTKELAMFKREITNPQGEWLPVSLRDPSKGFMFRDADSWSLTGALLRAEFNLNNTAPKDGTFSAEMPAWMHPMFTTDAFYFVQAAVKERGYNYLADFNDPDKSRGKTTHEDVVAVMKRALALFYAS